MNIIGHQKVKNLLDKAIAKKAVSHAYLFYGPESVGKFMMAFDFAQKLIGSEKKINSDLIILKPEIEEKKGVTKKLAIKIEQIRDFQHQLSLTAQSDGYKVAIIEEAEMLNKAAQNGLLKTLEEANPGVVLILVTSDEKKLLPTILSRCQKMRFGTVAESELRAELAKRGGREMEDIIFWSLGRPGLALNFLANDEELAFRKETAAELKKFFTQSVVERFAVAEEMVKDGELLTKKLNLWLIIFREIILGRRVVARITKVKALNLLDQTEKSLATIKNTNSNARLIMENLFLNF
ncbi:MAG: AAA family ATPase [Parcubacteria group bacterium]|jgi:DNA polymerase-3 subunit delta'